LGKKNGKTIRVLIRMAKNVGESYKLRRINGLPEVGCPRKVLEEKIQAPTYKTLK